MEIISNSNRVMLWCGSQILLLSRGNSFGCRAARPQHGDGSTHGDTAAPLPGPFAPPKHNRSWWRACRLNLGFARASLGEGINSLPSSAPALLPASSPSSCNGAWVQHRARMVLYGPNHIQTLQRRHCQQRHSSFGTEQF